MTRPVMIFGAGFGNRMHPLTRTCPKPLLRVAGRSLLDRSLDLARNAGAAPIVVNAHYLAEQMARHLSGVSDVRLRVEQPAILETGGGLRAASSVMGDAADCFTLNPDVIFAGLNPLAVLEAAWDTDRMGALLLLVPPDRAVGRRGGGDFTMDTDGRLTRNKAGAIHTGAQIISLDAVRAIPERVFSMNRVWDALAAEGRLFGCRYPGDWADIGYPEAIVPAECLLERSHAT